MIVSPTARSDSSILPAGDLNIVLEFKLTIWSLSPMVRVSEDLVILAITPREEVLAGAAKAELLTIKRRPVRISSFSGVPMAIMASPILMLVALMVALPGERRMLASSAKRTSFLPSLSSRIMVVSIMSLTTPI